MRNHHIYSKIFLNAVTFTLMMFTVPGMEKPAIEKKISRHRIPLLIKSFYTPKSKKIKITVALCEIGGKQVDTELNDWLNDPNLPMRTKELILFGILQARYKPATRFLQPLLKSNNRCLSGYAKIVLEKMRYYCIKWIVASTTKTKDGLTITESMRKLQFTTSDPIFLKISIRNDSKHKVYFARPLMSKCYTYYGDTAKTKVPNRLYGKPPHSDISAFFSPGGGYP